MCVGELVFRGVGVVAKDGHVELLGAGGEQGEEVGEEGGRFGLDLDLLLKQGLSGEGGSFIREEFVLGFDHYYCADVYYD